jgi:predicted secreted protein
MANEQVTKASNNQSGRPPKTWLVESILVTLFCCLPFGVVAIVNSSKVESHFYAGNIEAAERASKNAKTWVMWSFFPALVFWVLYFILMVAGIAVFS